MIENKSNQTNLFKKLGLFCLLGIGIYKSNDIINASNTEKNYKDKCATDAVAHRMRQETDSINQIEIEKSRLPKDAFIKNYDVSLYGAVGQAREVFYQIDSLMHADHLDPDNVTVFIGEQHDELLHNVIEQEIFTEALKKHHHMGLTIELPKSRMNEIKNDIAAIPINNRIMVKIIQQLKNMEYTKADDLIKDLEKKLHDNRTPHVYGPGSPHVYGPGWLPLVKKAVYKKVSVTGIDAEISDYAKKYVGYYRFIKNDISDQLHGQYKNNFLVKNELARYDSLQKKLTSDDIKYGTDGVTARGGLARNLVMGNAVLDNSFTLAINGSAHYGDVYADYASIPALAAANGRDVFIVHLGIQNIDTKESFKDCALQGRKPLTYVQQAHFRGEFNIFLPSKSADNMSAKAQQDFCDRIARQSASIKPGH